MKIYLIYHVKNKNFATTWDLVERKFSDSEKALVYRKIGPAKAALTSALKYAKIHNQEKIEFLMDLQILEVSVQPDLNNVVYSACFHLDKLDDL
jgi:hypothetical protein